jgi:BON domain
MRGVSSHERRVDKLIRHSLYFRPTSRACKADCKHAGKRRFSPDGEAEMPEIQERVLNELHFDPAIPRDRLTVRIQNNYVFLSGQVEWPYQKSCAEADVRRVPGVAGVTNDIAVRPHTVPGHAQSS